MAKDEKAPKVPKAKTAPKGTYFNRAEDRPKCKCSAPPKEAPK